MRVDAIGGSESERVRLQALLVTVTPVRVTTQTQKQFFGPKKDLLILKILG